MTVRELHRQLAALIRQGHGDRRVVVGFDDAPDTVSDLSLGDPGQVLDDGHAVPVIFAWWRNDGAYAVLEEEP